MRCSVFALSLAGCGAPVGDGGTSDSDAESAGETIGESGSSGESGESGGSGDGDVGTDDSADEMGTTDDGGLPPGDPLAGFVERSVELGIDVIHVPQHTFLTTGQAWADVDRDGRLDLFLTNQLEADRMFLGTGSGFVTPTWAADVARETLVDSGAVFADIDNDGYSDLYVLSRGANALLRNLGGTGFEDVSVVAGVADAGYGEMASFADFDADGFVDMYVANNDALSVDVLYRNNGDGTFEDLSMVLDATVLERPAFAASFFDYDLDGDPDIYVANDKLFGNVLWRNDGPGCGGWCFTDVSAMSDAGVEMFGMGLAIGDYDNDGDPDVFVTDIGEMVLLQNQTVQGSPGFVDVAASAGALVDDLGWNEVGWGTEFLDYDNDGWLDIYVALGKLVVEPAQPNCLLRNNGDGTFERLADVGGAQDPGASLGLAIADWDVDGSVDMLVGNVGGRYRFYDNQAGGHHWLELELSAGAIAGVNAEAIGARVELEDATGRVQTQQVIAGSSLGSGSTLRVHFGLGESLPVEARILWPDGTEQVVVDPPVDMLWMVEHPG